MDAAKYIAISRQGGTFKNLDVVANNVANANSAGFKADMAFYQSNKIAGASGAQVEMKVVSDLSQGPISDTGRPLDAAIDGEGFFVIQTPLGKRYTRAGNFRIDEQGQLVNPNGYPVQGDGGAIIFNETDLSPEIREDGSIRVLVGKNKEERGTLSVVKFQDKAGLKKLGNSLFTSAEIPKTADPEEDFRIVQGSIEGSNVNPVIEMTRMIEINRSAGRTSSFLNDINELQRRAISTIARQN